METIFFTINGNVHLDHVFFERNLGRYCRRFRVSKSHDIVMTTRDCTKGAPSQRPSVHRGKPWERPKGMGWPTPESRPIFLLRVRPGLGACKLCYLCRQRTPLVLGSHSSARAFTRRCVSISSRIFPMAISSNFSALTIKVSSLSISPSCTFATVRRPRSHWRADPSNPSASDCHRTAKRSSSRIFPPPLPTISMPGYTPSTSKDSHPPPSK